MDYKEFIKLKEELKNGNNQFLKQIFQENSSYCINKLVSKYRCTREDAEDIYIDAVLNFREKILLEKIETLTDIKSYLFSTCKNMFLVKLKKAQRVNEAFIEIRHHTELEDFDWSLSKGESFRDEFIAITEKALNNLPENYSKILKAFYFDKISLEEIAAKYGFANANVAKVTKSRCLQKLIVLIKKIQKQNTRKDNVFNGQRY